jgi:hypothetical protein
LISILSNTVASIDTVCVPSITILIYSDVLLLECYSGGFSFLPLHTCLLVLTLNFKSIFSNSRLPLYRGACIIPQTIL